MFFRALALTACIVAWASAAECNGKPDPNALPNLNPILTAPHTFVRSVPNASLYTVGSGDDTINVVHLWGTPYEMGLAHGTLMNATMIAMVDTVWTYLISEVVRSRDGRVRCH